MENIIVNQELLLGYLMNVLDDDEISNVERELKKQPKLRNELAKLQKQISPIDILLETVDPPANLTQRTCDNIWSAAQNESFSQDLNLRVFPNAEINNQSTNIHETNNYALYENKKENLYDNSENSKNNDFNKIIISSNNRNDNNVIESARKIRRRSKQFSEGNQTPTKKNILRPFILSAVIGIVLAVIIYPMTNYFVGQITQLVVRQKVQQLNKSVDVYSQLSESPAANSPDEINLSRYEWQELIPSAEHIFTQNSNSPFNVTKISDNEKTTLSIPNLLSNNFDNQSSSSQKTINAANNLGDYIFLGQSPVANLSDRIIFNETDNRNFNTNNNNNNYDLILNLSKPILISDGSKIRPAVGQSILIQNGRIFFRTLPQTDNYQNK